MTEQLYRRHPTAPTFGVMDPETEAMLMWVLPVTIDEPMLGLATTRQLIEELTTRIEMDGMLDYRTVDAALGGNE